MILILGSLIAFRVIQKQAEFKAQMGQRQAKMNAAPSVTIVPAEIRDIVTTFEATGSVEAPLNVKIAPKITGRIDYIPFHEGDPVKKGQVLVRIDPTEVEAGVRQAQAAVAEAEYRLAQAQLTENPTNVSVLTQIRQQRAGASSARADYNQVQKNYESQISSAQSSVLDTQSKINIAKAAITSAKANLGNSESRFNRIYGLYKQGFTAAQDVDDARAAVDVQKAALEAAESQLESAKAMKQSAEQQLNIVRNKGKADIEASRARMLQAQASVEYADSNKAQTAAYKQSISALRAGVDAAKANLASALSKRADTVLRSPMDGFVTGRYADPGAVVTPGQQVLGVQFMRQVWVTVAVPEEVTTRIHNGQTGTVRLDAYPDSSFTGQIAQINPSADPQSRQFTVRLVMENAQKLFRPGMFARVSFETDRVAKTIAIPREAVKSSEKGSFVFALDKENKVKKLPVLVGASDADWISVQGMKAGDKVVTLSAFPLRDGQRVSTGDRRNHDGKRGRR